MGIQKMRLQRGWSQQHLAQVSGLSTRTIQRIEAGQPATLETLKSLAAVFGVDFSALQQEHDMASQSTTQAEREEAEAFLYVRRLRGFYTHLARYVLVCAILVAVNLVRNPDHLWSLWVVGGWGLGMVIHGLRVFTPLDLLGADWEKRQVERRLGRPL